MKIFNELIHNVTKAIYVAGDIVSESVAINFEVCLQVGDVSPWAGKDKGNSTL